MRAVWVLLLFSLALALPAGAQSPVSISSSTAAVTFSAAKSGKVSAQLGVCSGNACTLSASSAAGSFVLSGSGPIVLAATANPGVLAVVQNGSLLFSETSPKGTAISGTINLLDFVQSSSGVYAVAEFQPADGSAPLQTKLFFNTLDLGDIAGGCQSSADSTSGEYIGSSLSGAGWSHSQSQFCPKVSAQISIPSLDTPSHPVGGPHNPLTTPEPGSLLMLLSGAFATRALLRRPSL